ncbi:glycosyltransferase family 39 protein [Ferrovibrio sp.]|uniref:glycosyltransferase family 39 protein n=1 Tax=Ferrovibrio sp. TaxID=1917215 RepID=UPI003D0D041E
MSPAETVVADRRLKHLLLAVFLAVAALLRFHGITDNDMWADELFSWQQATSSFAALIEQLGGDIHPPLYFLLLKLFVAVFGDSLFSLRLFSVIPSVLTVGLLFNLAWQRTNPATAVLAASIILFSPASIYYAHQVRSYALCEMTTILVLTSLLHYLESRRGHHLLIFLLLCTGLNYLHFIGPFFLAGIGALALWLRLVGRIDNRQFWSVFAVLAISGAALVPWLWFLLGRSHMVAAQANVYTGLNGVIEAIKVFVKLLGGFFPVLPALLIWAAGLWWHMRRTGPADDASDISTLWMTHILALVPFALFALEGIVGGPFIRLHPAIIALPWLALLLACCLMAMPWRWRWILGPLYGVALLYAGSTIPYRISQVAFSKVLDYAMAQKLTDLIVYSEELANTQTFLNGNAVKFIDVRAIPPDLCGKRVGVEVPANDAAYDKERHLLVYGLTAPGGRQSQYALPQKMTLLHVENFDYENTWKLGVTYRYQLYIFDTGPCRSPDTEARN